MNVSDFGKNIISPVVSTFNFTGTCLVWILKIRMNSKLEFKPSK